MTPQALITAVAAYFGLRVETLLSRNRTRYVAEARQAAGWVLRCAYPSLGLIDIGTLLGRDHTTVMFGLRAVEDRMDADPDLRSDLLALVAQCRRRSEAPAVPTVPALRPGDDRRFWSVRKAVTA